MADFYYRATLKWTQGSLGIVQNTYTFRHNAVSQDSDTILKANVNAWMQGIYDLSGYRDIMHTSLAFGSGLLEQITSIGTAIRIVGGFGDSTLSGTSGGDSEPATVAGSATARTNVSGVRGGKRFPPPADNNVIGGLLTNTPFSFLVAATVRWLAGYTVLGVPRYVAGVPSTKTGGWVDFNNTGLVINIPGTQVTRKPMRGL